MFVEYGQARLQFLHSLRQAYPIWPESVPEDISEDDRLQTWVVQEEGCRLSSMAALSPLVGVPIYTAVG